MGESRLIQFIVLINIILFVFIIGLVLFVFQFRKRKMLHIKEIRNIKTEYENAILQTELDAHRETMRGIGKEIHDGVGQKLTLASIYLKKQSISKNKEIDLLDINELIDESLSELRLLSKTLTNPERQNVKLSDLILIEVNRVNKIKEFDIKFTRNEEPRINEITKNNLHRIVQEFLHNSLKHSGCSKLIIDLLFAEDSIKLYCEDNGVGFDMKNQKNTGIGLHNIKERAEEMNGDLSIYSEKGMGTHLTLIVHI